MSNGIETGHIHPQRTHRHAYQYQFYIKHHGHGGSNDAQWLPEITQEEEFSVFDMADSRELFDHKGNLYGLLMTANDRVRQLGTNGQQLAKFPLSRPNEPWHGFPLWPLRTDVPHRSNHTPPKEISDRLVELNLLTPNRAQRLRRGKEI